MNKIQNTLQNLQKAGLISESAKFEDGLVWNCEDETIKKESLLRALEKWKSDRINDLKSYEEFTSPFQEISPYGSFRGVSANLTNWNVRKEKKEIQDAVKKELNPWLNCPKSRAAAVHIFKNGTGTKTFCLVKKLDEIVDYWQEVIECLYKFLKTEQGLTEEIKRNVSKTAVEVDKRKGKCRIRFANYEIQDSKVCCPGHRVNLLMAICEEFKFGQFIFDDQREQNKKFSCMVYINVKDIGNPFWIETKNGWEDYNKHPLLLLEEKAGGWFMTPKGGFPGVPYPDKYHISNDFTVIITVKDA